MTMMASAKTKLYLSINSLTKDVRLLELKLEIIVGMEHCRHGTPEKGPSSKWLPEWASLVQKAGGDIQHKTLSNLWCARVHREQTVRKGRLVGAVGQALQGSNSRRGSSIHEGTGSADRRIEKPLVTVKIIVQLQ